MSDKEITGFHGCDHANVESIRASNFRRSEGDLHYGFLGEGAYFFGSGFNNGADCARAWAKWNLSRSRPISADVCLKWAVLKVTIRPRKLLDGTTDEGKSFIHDARKQIVRASGALSYSDENLLKFLAFKLKIDVIIYDFWIKILESREIKAKTKFPNARIICVYEPESAIDKGTITLINHGLCT